MCVWVKECIRQAIQTFKKNFFIPNWRVLYLVSVANHEKYFSINLFLPLVLYFSLRPGQKCHSKVMHRKEVTHSNGSYERQSRGRKLADELGQGKKKNSHATLIDWCTGREWPVNCMTVISAWWRSNMRFQRSSEWALNYYITESRQKSEFQLEIGRGYRRDVVRKATPGRRGSGPPIELGSREVADKMR